MGAIFHLGYPKTATTTIQHELSQINNYIGTKHPRDDNGDIFIELDNYLRGWRKTCPVLPESFIFSEEGFTTQKKKGHFSENLKRLESIIRPDDKVLFTVRDPRTQLWSYFLERRHIFPDLSFYDAVNTHFEFDIFDYSIFQDFEALHSRLSFIPWEAYSTNPKLLSDFFETEITLSKLMNKTHQKKQKKISEKTKLAYLFKGKRIKQVPIMPKDELINNIVAKRFATGIDWLYSFSGINYLP